MTPFPADSPLPRYWLHQTVPSDLMQSLAQTLRIQRRLARVLSLFVCNLIRRISWPPVITFPSIVKVWKKGHAKRCLHQRAGQCTGSHPQGRTLPRARGPHCARSGPSLGPASGCQCVSYLDPIGALRGSPPPLASSEGLRFSQGPLQCEHKGRKGK